ncbi:odorant receptor 24a-like [Odontomachus brunneus]|uniref:odorant receptor 24a-like n=1 Tax=Odontomachus brunneus TaxID=486640 RepID=UPI0013F19FF9|nr:odorant receptor 24a-like [Odontomachus brunneus]
MSTINPLLKIGLQFIGVWPNVRYASVYRLIYILSILILQYFQYLYIYSHFKLSELPNLVDGLPVAIQYTLTASKLTALWIRRRVVYQVLTAMDDDWCVSMHVEQHLRMMATKADKSHLLCNTVFSLTTIAGVLYLLGDYAFRFLHLAEDVNVSSRHFPVKIQFPFEQAEQSPIYELLFIILFVHGMANTCTIATLDTLIASLVLHASGQIDIICHELRKISGDATFYESSMWRIGMLVERHNRVIKFSDKIHQISSIVTLMLVICNTLIIVYFGFLIVISVHGDTSIGLLVKAAFSCSVILTEIFIFCFAGEYLSFKSTSIADAAYDSLWYDIPPNQSRMMSLMIMKSQREITLTAGGLANLSLETFTTIMKTSASYVSVMLAIY